MASLPVAPVVKPSDLAGVENGHLGSNTLVEVQYVGRLHHLAARAFNALAMHAYAHAQGMPLTFTHGGTYRSYNQQVTLFKSRYEIGGAHGGCKNWDSNGDGKVERWCKKLVNGKVPATAAVPGTSNHGWGLAIDVAWDSDESDGIGPDDAQYIKGHPGWPWLLENAHRFGFSWELQSEPWHIRYVAGDNVPQAVLDWEAFAASLGGDPPPVPPTAPAPTPEPPAPEGGTYMQWLNTIRRTSNGNTVTILQSLLKSLGYSIQVDGAFGRQTEDGVKWFQALRGLEVDGIVGPKTWNALGSTMPITVAGESDQG